MIIFNREEYAAAIAAWDTSSKDYSTIKKLIPPNYVFTISFDQIDWLKKNNKCDDFCSEIGVYKNQLVLILCPLDVNGQKIAVNEYPYSILAELTSNLTLVETKEYTLVKKRRSFQGTSAGR
ncbi:hypothetical protein [Chryseobacterium proteolyticum]|uniref:hypothetical protein n=1 Tax=Chryseobacterium proteolyticum TaxID=118127 RepID=UPI003982DE7A